MDKGLTLSQLNRQLKDGLRLIFPQDVWLVAEISDLTINRSGHCYIELVEKDAINNRITAKARGTIWSFAFKMIKPYFETVTGHTFSAGIKLLLKVSPEFHEIYGFSLNVIDIDPSYTLGDIQRKRIETIRQLEHEGIFDMNKMLAMSPVLQHIAVISSQTAAGYGDFVNQLEQNSYSFKIYYKLFPAIMQGNEAEDSIISALEKIFRYEDFFDAVVIIRGGGSRTDLDCFDSYKLASYVAQFPIPIITGIGHERDESITDMVAHTKLKTPTAVAEFLIATLLDFENYLTNLHLAFNNKIKEIISNEKNRISQINYQFTPLIKSILQKKHSELNLYQKQLLLTSTNYVRTQKQELKTIIVKFKNTVTKKFTAETHRLNIYKKLLQYSSHNFIQKKQHNLQLFQETAKHLNPDKILKRGYSITLLAGEVIKDATKIKQGDSITTILFNGQIQSTVK